MLFIFTSISLILFCICNAEKSRLLLQKSSCFCPAIFDPVCCSGNIEYSSQCHANCGDAKNCQSGGCDFKCASTTCLKGSVCETKEGGSIGEVECVLIPDYCETDSDCTVKNVGNCCGYYPGCINNEYIPDLDQVKSECEESGRFSICGWIEPSGCSCNNNKCHEEYDIINGIGIEKTTTSSPTCILQDGYILVGTVDTCKVINYLCSDGYKHWFDSNCGCGCKPDCDSLPDGWSLAGTPKECQLINLRCDPGYEYWSNDCGCGCKQINNNSLTKKTCSTSNECGVGFECILDPECDVDDNAISKRKVCARTDGTCGGFVGALCHIESETCAYPCGSTLGICITYQYE